MEDLVIANTDSSSEDCSPPSRTTPTPEGEPGQETNTVEVVQTITELVPLPLQNSEALSMPNVWVDPKQGEDPASAELPGWRPREPLSNPTVAKPRPPPQDPKSTKK